MLPALDSAHAWRAHAAADSVVSPKKADVHAPNLGPAALLAEVALGKPRANAWAATQASERSSPSFSRCLGFTGMRGASLSAAMPSGTPQYSAKASWLTKDMLAK